MSIVCIVCACITICLLTYTSPHPTVVPVAGGDKEESGEEAEAGPTPVPRTPEPRSKGVSFPKGTTGQPTPAKAEE